MERQVQAIYNHSQRGKNRVEFLNEILRGTIGEPTGILTEGIPVTRGKSKRNICTNKIHGNERSPTTAFSAFKPSMRRCVVLIAILDLAAFINVFLVYLSSVTLPV